MEEEEEEESREAEKKGEKAEEAVWGWGVLKGVHGWGNGNQQVTLTNIHPNLHTHPNSDTP